MGTDPTDVAVIGGGPAGLAAALRLRALGRSVVVLEQTAYDGVRVGEHLAAVGVATLNRLGIGHVADDTSHLSSPGSRSIWGSGEAREVPAVFLPSGAGVHLDRPKFERSMAETLRQRGGRVQCRSCVVDVQLTSAGPCLDVNGPSGRQRIAARVVVDATGRRAWLARRLGVRPFRRDRLIGLALELPRLEDSLMPLVEAIEGGWWYSAPLPNRKLTAIYFTDADLRSADGLKSSWQAALLKAPETRERVGGVNTQPRGFPAQSQLLEVPVGTSWIAVGDASAAMDPLASAGLTQALKTGNDGGDAVHALLDGDERLVEQYALGQRSTFFDYCVDRGRYYRLEQRWPDAPFWKRRHRCADENAIWLDADARLVRSATEIEMAASLRAIAPDMNCAGLRLESGPVLACRLASKLRAVGGYGDLEIVSALQWLVSEGSLTVADPM